MGPIHGAILSDPYTSKCCRQAEFNQKQRAWEPKKNEYEKEDQKHRKFVEEAQDLKAEKKRKIKSHGTLFTRLEEIGDECVSAATCSTHSDSHSFFVDCVLQIR